MKVKWPTLKKILITVLTVALGFLTGEKTADYMNEKSVSQCSKAKSSSSLDGSQESMQSCAYYLNGPEV